MTSRCLPNLLAQGLKEPGICRFGHITVITEQLRDRFGSVPTFSPEYACMGSELQETMDYICSLLHVLAPNLMPEIPLVKGNISSVFYSDNQGYLDPLRGVFVQMF